MKAALAERLLAEVMQWTPEDVARERPILQALADLKYDSYQQYSPGMRFVESLALWLDQFDDAEERQIAFEFIKQRLVFLASAEMDHFAAIAYPDFIRPILLEHAAQVEGIPRFHVHRVLHSQTFAHLQGTTIFCGLSDGARIDFFRRSNRQLSHEQIFQSYDLSDEKLEELQKRLHEHGNDPPCRALVLLDDFSASGTSYFRREDGTYKGKVAKFLSRTREHPVWKKLVRFPETKIIVAVYAATDTAVKKIRAGAREFLQDDVGCFHVTVVQPLKPQICLLPQDNDQFVLLAEKYYDSSVEDEHTRKGGTDLKFGFAGGGLPLVLHHNTPNNSLFLLWAPEECLVRALFPRVSRHRSEG